MSDLRELLTAIPKAEHHHHFEGAVPWHLSRRLSAEDLPETPYWWDRSHRFADWDEFRYVMNTIWFNHASSKVPEMAEHATIIRWGKPADARGIAEVHVRSWQSTYRGLIPDDYLQGLSVARREERWTHNLAEGRGRTLVLEKEGRVIGFAGVGAARDEEFSDGATGEILGIYLLEDYWDRGLGRRLMTRALKELEVEGYRDVAVWVLEGNRRARAFYGKMGFAADGATKVEEREGFDLHEVRYTRRFDRASGPG